MLAFDAVATEAVCEEVGRRRSANIHELLLVIIVAVIVNRIVALLTAMALWVMRLLHLKLPQVVEGYCTWCDGDTLSLPLSGCRNAI